METHENCLAGVKGIELVFYYILKKEKEEIIMAKGKDGILYRLVKSSDESI